MKIDSYDVYIGIDPDSVKSGVAYVERATGKAEATSLSFADVLDYLTFVQQREMVENGRSVVVVVEAGWLNETNWHIRRGDNLRMAAAKGKGLGRCEQTGRLILEMAERIGLKTIARKPLRKCWKGVDRKITHEEIRQITGIMGRTNQEARDALLLAWVEAGLPIRVKNRETL